MKITRTSMLTLTERTKDLPVTNEQLLAWSKGELIQKVMPNLTLDQREFIINGTTPEEYKNIFD